MCVKILLTIWYNNIYSKSKTDTKWKYNCMYNTVVWYTLYKLKVSGNITGKMEPKKSDTMKNKGPIDRR